MAKKLTPPGIRAPNVRLIGFVPDTVLADLLPALEAVPGPRIAVHRSHGIAALTQAEPAAPLWGGSRTEMLTRLHTVQRRLEVACQGTSLLAMDPSAGCCPTGAVEDMLEAAWPALAAALAEHGRRHQWDIVLRWTPETALAPRRTEIAAAAGPGRSGLAEAVANELRQIRARREAALIAALQPAVLGFAPAGPTGAETEVAVTVLLAAAGEAVVEAALRGLPPHEVEGAELDMRGPLPPLSFAAVRVAKVDGTALGHAWRLLGLPARVNLETLHQHWRLSAFVMHPDRNTDSQASAKLAEMTRGYHLLRDLMRDVTPEAGTPGLSLAELARHSGYRLLVPSSQDVARETDIVQQASVSKSEGRALG